MMVAGLVAHRTVLSLTVLRTAGTSYYLKVNRVWRVKKLYCTMASVVGICNDSCVLHFGDATVLFLRSLDRILIWSVYHLFSGPH